MRVYERVYACVGVGVCVSMCMCTGEREGMNLNH